MSNLSDSIQVKMSTAEQFSLTEEAKTFIDQIAKKQIANFNSLEQPSKKPIKIRTLLSYQILMKKLGISQTFKIASGFYLFERDGMILQDDKQLLNDNHILCAQILIQEQFSQFSGLKSTISQKIAPLKPFQPQSKSLQILRVKGNHWIAISTVECTAITEYIMVYDSKYVSSATPFTTGASSFHCKVASVTKQSGSADCGLFANAYITSIAFGLTPHSTCLI